MPTGSRSGVVSALAVALEAKQKNDQAHSEAAERRAAAAQSPDAQAQLVRFLAVRTAPDPMGRPNAQMQFQNVALYPVSPSWRSRGLPERHHPGRWPRQHSCGTDRLARMPPLQPPGLHRVSGGDDGGPVPLRQRRGGAEPPPGKGNFWDATRCGREESGMNRPCAARALCTFA
jgi:hypothetical protein